ncbi:MAG: glutamine amidotransferase [Lachnospiraceae bacterium]|nr:glutamine amidotransferase [Lachnospiraceae bacterium]
MQKTVLLLILDLYADWEGAYVSSLLMNMGRGRYAVKTVSLTKEPVHSIGGFTVIPDYDLTTVPKDYEALLLIGGMSWRTKEAKQVIPLVEDALAKKKVVGGICDGSTFLGKIGVLNHVMHTSNDINDLKQWAKEAYTGEKDYKMQPAVRDGNIITANGTAPLEFAKEVLLALEVADKKQIDKWYDFYKLGCYEAELPSIEDLP